MKRITVISVHPDDETLGCGGTLLRHAAAGDHVSWIIVTAGWEPKYSPAVLATKSAEVDRVAKAYGMAEVIRLGLPTTKLRELPVEQIVDALGPALERTGGDTIYTIHAGDVHTDHQAVFEALSIVCKPFRPRPRPQRILSFETLSSTEAAFPRPQSAFVPNVFVDVSAHVERKIEIMAMFASEAQASLQPRAADSIRALARYRGATIGCEYAEAFMLIREIQEAR